MADSPEEKKELAKKKRRVLITVLVIMNGWALFETVGFFYRHPMNSSEVLHTLPIFLFLFILGNALALVLISYFNQPLQIASVSYPVAGVSREKDVRFFSAIGLAEDLKKQQIRNKYIFLLTFPFWVAYGVGIIAGLAYIWHEQPPYGIDETAMAVFITLAGLAMGPLISWLFLTSFYRSWQSAGKTLALVPEVYGRELILSMDGIRIFAGLLDEEGRNFHLKHDRLYVDISWKSLVSWKVTGYKPDSYRYLYVLHTQNRHDSKNSDVKKELLFVTPHYFRRHEEELFDAASHYLKRRIPEGYHQ